MGEFAFVNGRFMPLDEAVVPIEDRGFQFADGVYEVVATCGGEPFALKLHFERLERSLAALSLELDIRAYALEALLREGLELAGFDETLVYIQVTRGVAPRWRRSGGPSRRRPTSACRAGRRWAIRGGILASPDRGTPLL